MILESAMKNTEGKVKLQLKTNWVKGLLVLGIGTGSGLALAMALFDLIANNPKEGFALLHAWGPWAIIVALVVYLAWKLLSDSIGVVKVGVTAWVTTAEKGAEAQERTADAITKLAEQSGRNNEEVRRLAIYAAQEFPSIYGRLDQQDAMLRSNHDATLQVAVAVQGLAQKFDDAASERQERGKG